MNGLWRRRAIARAAGWGRGLILVLVLGAVVDLNAQSLPPIALPKPRMTGGKPVLEALRDRRTVRELSPAPLPAQTLSDLLWAGFGINRPDTGHRTAPSAMNAQEIDVYVANEQGVYRYNPQALLLEPLQAGDLRRKTTGQDFAQAPVTLIFVADYARMTKASADRKEFYSAIDTGCISQNIYLFCASAGLGTVVHDLDRAGLGAAMKLRPDQKIVLAQAVGFVRPGSGKPD